MAKEKTKATARADAASRQSAIDKRHRISKKVYKSGHHSRPFIAPGPGVDLSARRPQVAATSKLKSYFELHENRDKKDKKLETSVTMDKDPPPGFSFVPVGNPELTKTCKELSRENGYMIFIVSDTKEQKTNLSDHVQRVGYHFRSAVVEQACNELGGLDSALGGQSFTLTENDKIPETQAEIDKQADAALRDLFPRIPNLDREQIIKQSFQKGHIGNSRKGEPVVGLAQGIPLARRVQLAANAHIRHVHTRYDDLLRQTDWYNARRLVEPVCLEVIMKWRGDEETGRDQLDEILREVVLIPDSDDEEEGKDTAESASEDEVQFLREVPSRQLSLPLARSQHNNMYQITGPAASSKSLIDDPDHDEQQKQQKKQHKERKRLAKQRHKAKKQKLHRPDKQERRGFERYQRYAEAKKRAENGDAASAGLDYGDENGHQETPSQPRYPLRSMEGHQLLEGAPDGHPVDCAPSLRFYGYRDVGTPVAHPIQGLPEQERLPNTLQGILANPPLRRQFVHHEMPRDEEPAQSFILPQHQRNAFSIGGLPILTEAEHQQRQQQNQQNQRPQKRPRSPEVSGLPILTEAEHQQRQQLNRQNPSPQKRPRSPEDRILESIEHMDIANSPPPVRRSQQPLENAAPRRVQTAPQHFFDIESDRVDREPIYRALPERSDIIYVRDEHGRRLQLIDEPGQPGQQYSQPIRYEYVSAPRPGQDVYTFPVSRAQVPVSRPDMSCIDEANDSRQPILIGSSPYTDNVPAMAPQQPMVFLGGRKHNCQTSDNFEDIFYDAQQNPVHAQGGESRPPRSISSFAHQPVMRRGEQRQQPPFGIPSALPRASTIQSALQEIRLPEATHYANGQQSQPRPVERLPVYNERGEQIQISNDEVDRILQSGPPVYVQSSTRDPRQAIPQMMREIDSESPPRAQYVSQAGPWYDFLADRPRRVQSDMIMDSQPRYPEKTVYVEDYQPQPRQMQPIRRLTVEHIGADGQRYVTIPGVNGQPDEFLPVRSGPLPPNRPQSRMYRETTIVPERVMNGYDQHGRHDPRYPEQQQMVQQPRYGRNEVVVLDE